MLQLYAAIWRFSARRQIILIVLSLGIAGLAAAPLKFQQEIINHLTSGSIETTHLYWLGAGMSGVILLSLGLKWLVGFRANILGEDATRELRNRLITGAAEETKEGNPVLTGTLSTAVSAEAEEVGKFAGSAFSEPVLQIGTLVSVIGFIASTQPGLGLIVLSMIVPQVVLVLVSQGKVNALVKERVRILRKSTDRITSADLSAATDEVLKDFDDVFEVRRVMFHWKTSTKFLLSAINSAGLVAVLMLGGYLVIEGRTDVGTVVAATLGLGRIQGPTAFLIAFYRMVSVNRVKFELLRGLVVRHGTAAGPVPERPAS